MVSEPLSFKNGSLNDRQSLAVGSHGLGQEGYPGSQERRADHQQTQEAHHLEERQKSPVEDHRSRLQTS